MDDLKVLREFRTEVPDAEPVRLARIRNNWTTAAEPHQAKNRRAGRGWRLVAAGGLAATVGVAVVLVQGTNGSVPTPGSAPTVGSTQVLLAMAAHAEALPAEHPRPDQWIYRNELNPHDDGSGRVQYRTVETWWRVDGAEFARVGDSGKVEVLSAGLQGDDRSPADFQRYVQSLPTDPTALLNQIYQGTGEPAGSERDEKAFSEIFVLLGGATIISPDVNAALLRALALIPDVRMTEDVADVAGRHGVGISRARADGTRQELILDGTSGAYLGQRAVVEDAARLTAEFRKAFEQRKVARSFHDGELLHAEARVTTAVVNMAGQRP